MKPDDIKNASYHNPPAAGSVCAKCGRKVSDRAPFASEVGVGLEESLKSLAGEDISEMEWEELWKSVLLQEG